nr:hypothetical protein [Tanacetum cinerariifolium]
ASNNPSTITSMASTSTSCVRKSFKYDVFLNFRGDDTRNNFNYASSSWCLDELFKITECRMASEQTAYPVFYDVDPTEIRKQSGPVEEAFKKAFEKHENKEAAGRWSKALNEAGNLAGWESKKTANGCKDKFFAACYTKTSLYGRKVLILLDDVDDREQLEVLADIPIEGYEELSKQVVENANGLLLTIKVLGSLLCGQNEHGVRVLEQRSRIYISEDRELEMHDHMEEMGKNIVHRVNPDKPERHSR